MSGKRLYKSRSNKILCGVCGGFGNYIGIDPVIVRIIFLILCFAVGGGLILYIIAAIIIPKEPEEDYADYTDFSD